MNPMDESAMFEVIDEENGIVICYGLDPITKEELESRGILE
jgi:hypothetical protein